MYYIYLFIDTSWWTLLNRIEHRPTARCSVRPWRTYRMSGFQPNHFYFGVRYSPSPLSSTYSSFLFFSLTHFLKFTPLCLNFNFFLNFNLLPLLLSLPSRHERSLLRTKLTFFFIFVTSNLSSNSALKLLVNYLSFQTLSSFQLFLYSLSISILLTLM